ncbi:MAG: DUF4276 family protein [Candidatus Competibacteraceae bacterium]|nr:DUF4276 family protein [Candidatus Competibacteraceae bacterium]
MKIVLIVEGQTETVLLEPLRKFLEGHIPNSMPSLKVNKYDGRIPKQEKLKKLVEHLLNDGKRSADHVIALTDVYTGTTPPDFENAADAIDKMRNWVGDDSRFHPHAAQYDFEAWLLPYWKTIQTLAGHNKSAPPGHPEDVNHGKSPAYHIHEIFRIGTPGRKYVKTRDAKRILSKNDIGEAIRVCPQLKALVNTILTVSGAEPLN